jgi:hypothetical protein
MVFGGIGHGVGSCCIAFIKNELSTLPPLGPILWGPTYLPLFQGDRVIYVERIFDVDGSLPNLGMR